ncbi:MAG: glycosyltransferase family 39 protein [Candidatus Brocadia sp.]|nr:glycosyltransferase family 39 protein [Candidatus Brocadia sp.]MDG6025137.1 glycosyltransferase family 39 protein [Candidatus Brocadia sp.]
METKLNRYSTERLTKKDIPFLLGLISLGFVLFLFYTWSMPLIDPDEPRYASAANDMVTNNHWIVPHFNGAPRINKPPLFYWVIAISYKIFGISEFSARLPATLAAIGTVLITYLWGKRLEDRKNGFWAGVMLMASPLFFFISRLCITDMLLTFFVCASLYLFFIEYTAANKNNLRRLFLYFLLSMVFLVKGPVGILLFILITMGFLLWIRDFQSIRRLWYLPGFLLFLGIICAWGIPFWLSLGKKQIFTLLSQEMSGRFVSGYAHPQPFYYYVPVFFMGFFPWSLFVFIPCIPILKQGQSMPSEEKRQVYFFCSWFILTVTFFSLSHSKLMTYILPISPSIALLTKSLSRWDTEDTSGKRHLRIFWFLLFVSATIPPAFISAMLKWAPTVRGLSTIHMVIPIIILFVGTIVALYAFFMSRRFLQTIKVLCFTNCLVLCITMAYSVKYLGAFRSTKDLVQNCLSDKQNYMLFSYGKTKPSLVFYSGKNVLEIEGDTRLETLISDQASSRYVVMSIHDYQKKQEWIHKEKLHAVYQTNTHVILENTL